jgi:hypothetical protein
MAHFFQCLALVSRDLAQISWDHVGCPGVVSTSTMTSAASQQRTMSCLSDLPTGALAHLSRILASPSRALFAVALTSRDADSSSAIVGGQWDALDFGDIEKELAAKLSDDDISGVLLCVDAVSTLKNCG